MLHPLRRTGRDGAARRAGAMEGVEGRRVQSGLLAPGRGRALGAGGLILALAAACSSAPTTEARAPRTVAHPEQSRPVGDRQPSAGADLCKAGEMQWLVGKPRTEIPVPVEVVNRRVTCTTCPITEDYSAYRLNIFYNHETGIIEQVRCG